MPPPRDSAVNHVKRGPWSACGELKSVKSPLLTEEPYRSFVERLGCSSRLRPRALSNDSQWV